MKDNLGLLLILLLINNFHILLNCDVHFWGNAEVMLERSLIVSQTPHYCREPKTKIKSIDVNADKCSCYN